MNAMTGDLAPYPARRRQKVHLWIPLLPILVLLSPVLLLLAMMGAVVLRAKGVPPGAALIGIARMLLALPGTRIQVEAPDASVQIVIF